jgi:hypothetical protein
MRTFLAAIFIFFAGTALGAEMTNQQRTAVRAAIFATPAALALLNAGDVPGIQA